MQVKKRAMDRQPRLRVHAKTEIWLYFGIVIGYMGCYAHGATPPPPPANTTVSCTAPTVSNATYLPTGPSFNSGDTTTYTCATGYLHTAGNLTLACQANGTWIGTTPTCTIATCATGSIANDDKVPTNSSINYGATVTYSNQTCYEHASGDASRPCQADGSLSGSPPSCNRVACIQEPSSYMTTNPDKTLHNFNDVIEYACILGYNHSSGDLLRTCLPDGNWNGTKPECVIITCDTPTAPPHSSIAPLAAFVNYNTNITYTCDLGYNRTGGDASRRCTEFATFEGTEANCTFVQCASPIGPSMEIYPGGPTMYDFNTTINATCELGYNLTGGDDIRTCLHTGSWDGNQAVCTIIECSPPDSVDNSTMDLIKNPYVYGDAITYTCVTGYELTSGDATRTCTETQAWTGTAPNCTIIHCQIPPKGVYNTYAPALADYIYLDAVTYTCYYGYNYTSTMMDSTCLADKTWSFDPAPVCSIITCDIIDVPHMGFTPISTTTLDFNTTATYYCDIGYNHTFGDLERTCYVTGEWTNILPNCTIIECPAPATVAYSSLAMNMTKYVYQDTITYACDTGYEMLIGDASRTCTETTDWNGTAPVCTIIHCPIPADGNDNKYAPVLGDYVYKDMVNYTCNTGYKHTSGDLSSICLPDKTWSATPPPVCEIVKCAKIDVPNSSFTPPTATTHDFNTTIVYSCDIGYNHTYGDLVRTCNESAMWNGLMPVCTLITCDPPAPIMYTYYNPNLAEHNWHTDIDYSCDADYHYISGINKTTCNESGAFPPVDLNCSVQHTMILSSSEPYLTWINSTVNTMDTVFDFDGICDVTIQCTPPATFNITHTISGTQLTMTVTENAGTVFNEYYCSLIPYQGLRTFALVNRTVFYGEEILGLQARVVHDSFYLAVGRQYHFEANVTAGTNVTIIWSLDANSTPLDVYDGNVTYMDLNHTFLSPTENVTVYANNFVTPNVSYTIEVYVIYAINMARLTVNSNLRSTTENAHFILSFDTTTLLPLSNVNITVSLLNGSGPFNYTEDMQSSVPGSFPYAYDCTYPTQGQYNVTAVITNPVDTVELYQVMEIWDHLSNISIFCHTNCTILVTNTSMLFEFTGVPVSGFEYSIYMGDGHIEQNANDSILYVPYALSNFSHIYTYPGYFNVHWNVSNYGRSHSGNQWVTIQNKITNFKAFSLHRSQYMQVGKKYNFTANGTGGTNVTIEWKMHDTDTNTSFFNKEFSKASLDNYIFTGPKKNVTVEARNLVSNFTIALVVEVFYEVNGVNFSIDNKLGNTTSPMQFYFKLLNDVKVPMLICNITINFNDDANTTNTTYIDEFATSGTTFNYSHLFDMQGEFTISAKIENLFGVLLFKLNVTVWDSLLPLVFEIINPIKLKYIMTNTVGMFQFNNTPNYGFEYSIDFGDGTPNETSPGDSILYSRYNLSLFNHTYTKDGVYTVTWKAYNGEKSYDREEKIQIHVQNIIPFMPTDYAIEPNKKKYPWINLQKQSISVNITLNSSELIPTNATCTFDADDGTTIVENLVYNGTFFEHTHYFLNEGYFNSTFNCSNDVSNYVYKYEVEVRKCLATDISLVYHNYVPLNVSDSVTVYFHFDNGGFALIPYFVYFRLDYGDNLTSGDVLYNLTTYDHDYTARGNYSLTFKVYANVTQTHATSDYSLRLGLMYFEYNTTVQFINTTVQEYLMYGIHGLANYTIDFDDTTISETCTATNQTPCSITHYCPTWGYHFVEVVGTNGSFIELDNVNITCDNPIKYLTVGDASEVTIPNGTVDAKLILTPGDLFLPKLTCTWNMGEPFQKEKHVPMSQRVTHWKPFNFTYQYIALGRHTITIECYNLINYTRIETTITVSNRNFIFIGIFDRFYSQRHSPLPISAMLDTEIFSRLDVKADYLTKTHTNLWKPGIDVLEPVPNRHNLEFSRGTMDPGIHEVNLSVCFVKEPDNCIYEPTFVRFIVPPPHAEIVGGRRRNVKRGQIEVDALTLSYDPSHPGDTLTFNFSCVPCNATTADPFADALQKYEASDSTSDCDVTLQSLGLLQVNTDDSPKWSHYVIEATVKNSYSGTSRFIQVLAINNDDPLTIRCKINCLSKVAVSSKLQLISDMTNDCSVKYNWRLHKYGTNRYDEPISLNDKSEEGENGRSLTILPHKFQPATRYLISLNITDGKQIYGPAYHEFVTNQPPRGGLCKISQYNITDYYEMPKELQNTTTGMRVEVKAVTEYYNCTCSGWEDEGFTNNTFSTEQPLFYTFYVSYSKTVPIRRQIVYFDPGATSNLVAFQAGDEEDNYNATVVLRITDVLGDYTGLKYLIRSVPELLFKNLEPLSNEAQFIQVREYFDQFEEELIKANRTWDYRTIARRVMDMASVYNKFNMNSTHGAILTPEDLLSLGYQKTANNEAMTWSDYWKLIVESFDTRSSIYLASLGEDSANMLLSAVSTWPETKRMTLIAIDTIARALNASMTKRELTNVTEAVYGAKTCSYMSDHLKNISKDRTFPNTEHLEEVIQTLSDLLRNILASLNAVLTPNFPQDPSVDEMRNYLEFIEVFKTKDGIQPLSLQEQTFLAQKQLQKYYVQKYYKEIASKKAIGDITKSLQVLAYVLGKMSHKSVLENDYFLISVENQTADVFKGSSVERPPRVALDLSNLTVTNPMSCHSSVVQIRSVVFKSNPYFWGKFGDRILSYVPIFEIEGASITNPQLQFRLKNKVEPKCIDKQPTYDEDDPNKMIYIMFYRQHPEDDILIFLRPNASELVYKLYFNKDDKPDITEDKYTYTSTMNKNDDTWTVEDGYKLLIKASEYSETGKIWIGLQPLLDHSKNLALTKKKFCANVTSVNCLAWLKQSDGMYKWDKDYCQVSRSSTLKETVCTCPNPGNTADVIVGTTFYVPHNIVDFKKLDETVFIFGRAPVIAILIAVASVYVLLISWAWREDIKDQYKWSYSLLRDNDIADSHFYIMRVYTGLRSGSGTSSKVGFVLVGDDGDTTIRMMDDNSHIGFDSGSVRTFVMSTRRHLGDIVCIRIWHDDTGSQNSSWYLNKITLTDMRSGKRYLFPANKWFDYDSGDTKVDRVLNAEEYKDVHGCQEMAAYTIAEHHMWLSVLLRPMRSNFSRVQRLSCLLSMIYLTMIILTLIIRTSDQIPEDEAGRSHFVVGPFRFSMENATSAFIAVAGASLVILVVSFFFRKSECEDGYPNLDSMLRRAYRKVNDKLHIDKSVVGRRYWSPAEDAIEYTHFFLPHFCVYFAWSLLAVSLIVATYLVCTLSVDWQLIKSEEWMTAICVSFFASFIGVEGVKILILLIVYALFYRRGYQVPDPKINNDELEEITRYNSATLDIGPNYEDVLDKPEIPDNETLLMKKIDRIRSHQLLKIFTQLLFFSGVLYLVYTISYETRDPRSFDLKNHVEKKFAFDKVTDLQSYTEWLETTFIEVYFQDTFYGARYRDHDMKLYMKDLANLRVGPARLSQHRVKPDECVGPLKYIFHTCHDTYDEKIKETSDYCLQWHDFPCPVAEKSEYFTSDAWLYVSPDEVWGFPTVATYATYGGGGYFMKLDVNKDVCGEIFKELVKYSWFDMQTRSVILEFTLYNANTNLFIYSKFVAEFPEVGGFIPYMDMQVFRLYASSGPDGEYIVFMQFIFMFGVLFATLHCLYQLVTDAKAYLKVFWNILDMVALVMSYTTISIFIYKVCIIEKTLETFHEDKNAYVGFENLAFYDFVANTSFGVLVFLLSIRVSRILGYSGKINEMAAVISHAASDLYGFLLIFGITYLSYVVCGTLLFGKDTSKYKDVFETYDTLTEAVIGKNRVASILTSKPGWAEFFYFTFVLFVLMTLATMAAAILNFSISIVKQEQKEIAPTNIGEVIFEKIAAILRRLVPKKREDADENKPRERKDSDAELKDILTDLSTFMKGFAINNKPVDKYKLTHGNDNPA